MFESVVLPILLVIANVTGAGMIVPQVVRLQRSGGAAGVSAAWAGLSFAMNVSWVLYALAQGLWGLVPVSAVGAALYLVIGRQLFRIVGVESASAFARAAVLAAIWPLAGFLLGGWEGAGLATGLAYGAQFVPAAVSALRSADVSGISAWTWALAWIEAAVWIAYALAESDVPLLVGGSGGVVVSSVILGRLFRVTVSNTPHSTVARSVPARATH